MHPKSRSSIDTQVAALGRTQLGAVSLRQLRDLGLSYKMIRARVDRGFLEELYPKAFVMRGAPIRWETRLLAAQLSLGDRSAVTHRSCAALRRLDGFEPNHLELTLAGQGRRRLSGVRIHRTTSLDTSDLQSKGPFRLSRPERLMLELASVVTPRLLEVALDGILFKRLSTFSRINAYLARARTNGLKGVSALEQLLAERDPDQAPGESIFETDFYRLLKRSPWADAAFQHKVYDEEGFIGRLDVAYPPRRTGLEGYSKRWHSPGHRVTKDSERHNRLEVAGWRVLYVTYERLNRSPQQVLDQLGRLLSQAS